MPIITFEFSLVATEEGSLYAIPRVDPRYEDLEKEQVFYKLDTHEKILDMKALLVETVQIFQK